MCFHDIRADLLFSDRLFRNLSDKLADIYESAKSVALNLFIFSDEGHFTSSVVAPMENKSILAWGLHHQTLLICNSWVREKSQNVITEHF